MKPFLEPLQRFFKHPIAVLLVCACVSNSAFSIGRIDVSGFASIAAGKLNRNDDVTFMDYDGDWSFRNDTMLGLQGQMDISDQWSVTAQVLSRGFSFDGTSDFEPTLEWMFLKYQWSPETNVRVGRLRTPLYLYSDTLEIGYSYLWARPPVDTYTYVMTALTTFEGADVSTSFDFDSFYLDMSLFAGATDGEYLNFDMEFDQLIGANFKFHFGDVLIRYGITFANTDASSSSLDPLVDGFNQFAVVDPIFSEIADAHVTKDAWFQYHSLGARYDYQEWTFIAEQYWVNGPEKGFANDAIGWYFTLSKQIDQFTPYFVVGYYKNWFSNEIKSLLRESESIVPTGSYALYPPTAPQFEQLFLLDQLRAADLEATEKFNERGESYTVGVRYDFHRKAALKLEAEYLESNALLFGDDLHNKPDETLVTTIVLDVVF